MKTCRVNITNNFLMLVVLITTLLLVACEITIEKPTKNTFYENQEIHFSVEYNGVGEVLWKSDYIDEDGNTHTINDSDFQEGTSGVGKGYPWEFKKANLPIGMHTITVYKDEDFAQIAITVLPYVDTCEGCMIDGECIEDGTESEDYLCAVCDANSNPDGWSPKASTVECRASASECDISETCDGENLSCPDNAFADEGTNCGDTATECSAQDTCNAEGICLANHFSTETTCGNTATDCVNQDYCDGNGACTDNGYWDEGTNCGDSVAECVNQNTCDAAGSCTDNGFATNGTICQETNQCVDGSCVDCYDTYGCGDYTADNNDCTDVGCVDNLCTDINDDTNECNLDTSCTSDVCLAGNCVVDTITTGCYIDSVCVAEGASYDEDGCVACSPENSKTTWTNVNGVICAVTDDGNPCTDEICFEGTCKSQYDNTNECPDGLDCTTTMCVSGYCFIDTMSGCAIDGACYSDLELKGNTGDDVCKMCDVSVYQEIWTNVADGTGCNDDDLCTYSDQCTGGACDGTTYTCTNGECTGDGNCACDENYQDNDSDTICKRSCENEFAPVCDLDGFKCYDGTGTATCRCTGSYSEYFHDDFENASVGNWVSDGETMEIATGGADNSEYAMRLHNTDAESNSGAYTDISVNSPEKLSYYLYSENNASLSASLILTTASGELLNIMGGGVKINSTDTGYSVVKETWYLVEVEFDWNSNEVDLYSNGTIVAENIALSVADSTITRIRFRSYFEDSAYLIDDVRFYNCEEITNKIANGYNYSCGITSESTAKCWGDSSYVVSSNVPVSVTGLNSGVVDIYASMYYDSSMFPDGFNCAVLESGTAKCWGDCTSMHIGDGSTRYSKTPITVSVTADKIAKMGLGFEHVCYITTTGAVGCWGYNDFGQLGDGTTMFKIYPINVSGFESSGAAEISTGGDYTCLVTTVGGAKCWGRNLSGQLGDGTTGTRLVPVDVVGLTSGVKQISAGDNYTCAVTYSGAAKCWGFNSYGQLGDGTTANRHVPVSVVGLTSGVKQIASKYNHTCAVMESGGVKCWGSNRSGQLGNGNTTTSYVPIDASGISNAVEVSVHFQHSCARLADGSAKCWGAGYFGQLGDGNGVTSYTPVTVSNF